MSKVDRIHPDEGIEKLLDLEVNLESEIIPLNEGLHRVSAEDIYADYDVPNFDKSPYDGYVFRGEDTIGATKENPVEFSIIEEIPAGHFPEKELGQFEAAKILTGGPIPKGGNVCIKYENTKFTEEKVYIFEEHKPNSDIIKAGEDTKKGSLLIEKGTVLTPGHLGQLASQGHDKISVYKKPTVGLFATGDELKNPGEELEPGEIFDSNNVTFNTIFINLGFEVKNFGIVKDDLESIEKATEKYIDEVDLLVTTGGASVGDYDYALSSIENIGGEVLFWKTQMKPGGSIVISRYKNKTVLGLSGNPGSAVLGLFRVTLPYLKKMLGRQDIYSKKVTVFLKEDFKKKSPSVRIVRGRIDIEDGKVYFTESKAQGNGVLSSFVDCNFFVEIDPGTGPLKAGTKVKGYEVGYLFESYGG